MTSEVRRTSVSVDAQPTAPDVPDSWGECPDRPGYPALARTLSQPGSPCGHHRLDPIDNLELAQDVRDMVLDRAQAVIRAREAGMGETAHSWSGVSQIGEHRCHLYFTARVSSPPHDLGKSQRQDTYLRPLRSQHNLSIHFGHFLDKRVTGSLLDHQGNPTWVMETALTRDEKGSDVNLATYLILDAIAGLYDVAIVLSNDSDLAEPVRRVRQRFGVGVGVPNPTNKTISLLRRVASWYKAITLPDVRAWQYPRRLKAGTQTIERPRGR